MTSEIKKISTDEHEHDEHDEHDEKGHLYKAKPSAPALMEQDIYTG